MTTDLKAIGGLASAIAIGCLAIGCAPQDEGSLVPVCPSIHSLCAINNTCPTEGATIGSAAFVLGSDGQFIYIKDRAGLHRISPTAGVVDLAQDSLGDAGSWFIGPKFLYWFDPPGSRQSPLRRVPETGGAVETLAENVPAPGGIYADDTAVYYGYNARPYANGDPKHALMKKNFATGATTTLSTLPPGGNIVSDGANLYWWVGGDAPGIYTIPKAGGSATLAYPGQHLGVGAYRDSVFYFIRVVSGGAHELFSLTQSSGAVKDIGPADDFVIAPGGDFVVEREIVTAWGGLDYRLELLPAGGGSETLIAHAGSQLVRGFAVLANRVYWTYSSQSDPCHLYSAPLPTTK